MSVEILLAKIDELIAKFAQPNNPSITINKTSYYSWVTTSHAELRSIVLEQGLDSQSLIDPYLTAIKKNPIAIFLIPESERQVEMYLDVAKNRPDFIKEFPIEMKRHVIDTLTPDVLLSANFECRQYFPKEEKYQAAIARFLSNIEHVVILIKITFYSDFEIHDAYMVYSTSEARAGKTVWVDATEAYPLLDEIKLAQTHVNHQLNLVVLGHFDRRYRQLGDLDIPMMVQYLKDYTNIYRLTLLTCNSARARRLEQENVMRQRYYRSQLETKKMGLILTYNTPHPREYQKFFHILSDNDNQVKTDGIYILIKNPESNSRANLVVVQANIDNLNEFVCSSYYLDNAKLLRLSKKIAGKNEFPFPSSKSHTTRLYYRGGKAKDFLTPLELDYFEMAMSGIEIYSRTHPRYKEHKTMFPFLASATLSEKDRNKLLPCLLSYAQEAIEADPDITRPIEIKGYTKYLYVDTAERRFKASNSKLYFCTYTFSLFNTKTSNIDSIMMEDEWDRERNRNVGDNDQTGFKSIKVVTRNHPRQR